MPTPNWLRRMMLADEAMQFAPRPTVDDIVARSGGVPLQQTPEDFLRMLASDAQRAREAAVRSVDSGYASDTNIFGLPVKTIDQGRSLGERNLPGIGSLSPEDQIALAQALDKGAMLRSMTAVRGDPTVRRIPPRDELGYPSFRVTPADRVSDMTGADRPMVGFLGGADNPTMSMVMSALQNKRGYRALTGRNPDLPNPPALRVNPLGLDPTTRPSNALSALGEDVGDLAMQVRKDQIDSRVMAIQEMDDAMRQARLDREMRASADAVAAREAYARQYGGLPPDTVREMDRGVNRDRMLKSGVLDRMTGDPLHEIHRTVPPVREDVSVISPAGVDEPFADYYARTTGNDILKGLALGHVLSYPLIYGAYKMMQPQQPQQGNAGPARSLGLEASLEDIPVAAAADRGDDIRDLIAAIPLEAPDMEPIVMPRDEVGIPEPPQEDMVFLEDDTAGAPVADDLPPPPTVADLDSELRKAGLSGVPEWYLKAMNDPAVTMIDGKPKREAYVFSPQAKEFAIERQYRMAGMR